MSVSSNNENPEGARPSETGMSTARGEAQPGSAAARQSLPPLFWIMAAVAAAALVVAGVLAFNLGSHSLQGRDPNAALGQLEGKTPDELQADLDRIVEEGMFNIHSVLRGIPRGNRRG